MIIDINCISTLPSGAVLNPCPSCGSKAYVRTDRKEVRIICSKNGCRDVIGMTEEDAVRSWNEPKRASLA